MTSTVPYSILITDDDVQCRETLRDLVEGKGYRAVLASSGEEAVDIVREEPVHLALMDLHLPHMTGLDALRLVLQINELLPCILVTADATADVIQKAFSVKAYSVIPKPVSRDIVLYTIVRALAKAYSLHDVKQLPEEKAPPTS